MDFDLRVISLPMVTKFRGVTVRETALIHGPMGWGEFSVFDDYDDQAAALWLLAAIEAAFIGWPDPMRESIPVNATVPAVMPSQVETVLSRFDGCTVAKVKVAEGDDLARVRATLDALGPHGRIRLDANGGWSIDQAERAISEVVEIAGSRLEYVEQPCRTVEELAQLRKRLAGTVKIAADESIRRSEDPYRVVELQAADVLILKAAPLGGVRRSLEIVKELGLPAVVSSELSSSIGIRAGLALAAALPELPYACGLATAELFRGDVCSTPLRPTAGQIALRPIEPDLVAQRQAPAERQEWWRQRALAAWQAGTAELVQARGWQL